MARILVNGDPCARYSPGQIERIDRGHHQVIVAIGNKSRVSNYAKLLRRLPDPRVDRCARSSPPAPRASFRLSMRTVLPSRGRFSIPASQPFSFRPGPARGERIERLTAMEVAWKFRVWKTLPGPVAAEALTPPHYETPARARQKQRRVIRRSELRFSRSSERHHRFDQFGSQGA